MERPVKRFELVREDLGLKEGRGLREEVGRHRSGVDQGTATLMYADRDRKSPMRR